MMLYTKRSIFSETIRVGERRDCSGRFSVQYEIMNSTPFTGGGEKIYKIKSRHLSTALMKNVPDSLGNYP